MIEYLPWSKKTLGELLMSHQEGNIPSLDIELTGKCTGACCIYCDSKPYVRSCDIEGEIDWFTIKKVILDAAKRGLKWIYTCGLGEPMEDEKFWDLVYLLKEKSIGLSMFSNGVFIKNRNIAYELKNHNVNIILKMDTFNEENFDKILGRKGIASKIYAARDYLLEAGYGKKGNYTDLAFSIVPTQLSVDGIDEVVKFCEQNGIFASIGELEQAGEVINNNLNDTLSVSEKEIKKLKTIADSYFQGSYMRPICPCILTGIHLDNFGNCVVDENTGLNCKWFLLKDPCSVILGNVRDDNIFSLYEKVNTYRKDRFKNNFNAIQSSWNISYTFGGCGGNPKDIIELVLKQYE